VQQVAITDEKSPILGIIFAPKIIAEIVEPLVSAALVVVFVVYVVISGEDLRNRFLGSIGNRHQ